MGLQQSFITYKGNRYPHYYLCNYLPVSAGQDRFSHSLLKFKQGRQPDLSAWIDCSLEILSSAPSLPFLPSSNPVTTIIPSGTILVRALHHQEWMVEGQTTSLDKLGLALSAHFKCLYLPGLLRKSRNVLEMKGLSQIQREQELKELYFLDNAHPEKSHPLLLHQQKSLEEFPEFLILDDILTTGTTAKMIIEALQSSFPLARLRIFTLAKANYDAGLNKSTLLKGQRYRLEEGMDWTLAEEAVTYHTYYTYGELTAWIKGK
ncbi:hypothetical protein ACX0G9_10305 [Flavitalea flava]